MKEIVKGVVMFVALLTLVVYSNVSQANAKNDSLQASSSASSSTSLNRFELFWPVTAGKTVNDSWYFFKRWKEDLRGMVIFGKVESADYKVLLATKRLLEADHLLTSSDLKAAEQTFEMGSGNLKEALKEIEQAGSGGSIEVRENINRRLGNIEKLLLVLTEQQPDNAQISDFLRLTKELDEKI